MMRIAHLLLFPAFTGLWLGPAPEDPVLIENLELACTGSPKLSGPWLCFRVDEAAEGGMDLDGDGDALDSVLVAYDAESDRLMEANLALTPEAPRVIDERVHFMVRESRYGGADLNGDGDAEDDVPFWLDLETGETHNTGFASLRKPIAFGRWLALRVRESDQGDGSLNGDGDIDYSGVAHGG